MRRLRQAGAAALLLCGSAAMAQEAPAPEGAAVAPATEPPLTAPSLPEKLGEVPGTWDLAREGTNRRCVMTLFADNGEAGRRLAFPAGCRRALPITNAIAGWLFTDGAVRLVDRNVRPILMFARRPDQRSLIASAESGERYSFVPLDIAAMRPPQPEAPEPTGLRNTSAGPPPDAAPPKTPPPQAGLLQTAPTIPAELTRPTNAPVAMNPAPPPGLYALDRFQDRDTCRLVLDGTGGAVRIAPGCKDGGLEVFDPVRWRYAEGRMTLSAKRGHSIDLVPNGDGRWRRDPEVGTTFILRRVEP